jgi:hypothetical protein
LTAEIPTPEDGIDEDGDAPFHTGEVVGTYITNIQNCAMPAELQARLEAAERAPWRIKQRALVARLVAG